MSKRFMTAQEFGGGGGGPARAAGRWGRLIILAAIVVVLASHAWKYSFVRLPASHDEMIPRFKPASLLVLYSHGGSWKYLPGDVLWVGMPDRSDAVLMRILAQDRGEVALRGGKLFVDGKEDFSLFASFPAGFSRDYALKDGEVFLCFDNQKGRETGDSFARGPFRKDGLKVHGKVFFGSGD